MGVAVMVMQCKVAVVVSGIWLSCGCCSNRFWLKMGCGGGGGVEGVMRCVGIKACDVA